MHHSFTCGAGDIIANDVTLQKVTFFVLKSGFLDLRKEITLFFKTGSNKLYPKIRHILTDHPRGLLLAIL